MNGQLSEESVNALLQSAKSADKNFQVFGASKHQYILNPVTTTEKVHAFEEKYGLKLPEAYVRFLTEIGNGGAGPYYGLYSLEELESWNRDMLNQEAERQPLIDHNLDARKWNTVMQECEDDEKYDEIMQNLHTGMLVIGTQGCTFDNILMCKGSECGKIVYIDWNLLEDSPPFLTGLTFEEWYMSFFQEIIQGNDVRGYGYKYLGSEEDLIRIYENANLLEKKNVIASFLRFHKLSDRSRIFLMSISQKELDAARLSVLLKSDSASGVKLFENFLSGSNIAAAVECVRQLPQKEKDRFYQPMLEILYTEDKVDKERILYYLHDCNCRKAADILQFAMNKKNPEEERKAAIYVMGQCADVSEYIDDFILLMREDSYWIVHTALQSAKRAGLQSPELTNHYQWMKEKYRDDEMMMNNLKR